ncbi:MAG: metal-dependent transcriptional regulator [Nanoarchaeota archaeon]|nr:metal-dependent transcriptional regulator [Nanoarchaeota archaeon]
MRLTQSEEDYLKAIYSAVREKGYAKVKDIANQLKVSPPSVSGMLVKLNSNGLVNYEKYAAITLTKKGEIIGKTIKTRHETIKNFLQIILIPEEIAYKSACEIEHRLDPKTIGQLTKFVEFVKLAPIHPKWLEHFRDFSETGKYDCKIQKD